MEAPLRPSPLGMAVLSLLIAGPLHPYGMQRLLKQWGKDRVINMGQRANLYKMIKRLHEAGLIEVSQTERDQNYPERSVYRLTDEGRRVGAEWLAGMIATPAHEFPPFPAALSFAMILPPEQALAALEQRAAALGASLARVEQHLTDYSTELPRVTLLDDEYLRDITAAELRWVSGLVTDLRSGALSWDSAELRSVARENLAGFAAEEFGDADHLLRPE